MPPTRATPLGNGPEQTHVDGEHLEGARDTDRPSKIARCEAVAKRRAQPITCICQDAGEAHAGRDQAIDLSKSSAWYVRFDIRPEHLHASTAIGHLSNSQEEKDATPPSPALRHGRASVIPGSGSWHSCQAPKHIAKRHRPNACPSSAPRCHRLPSLHRCRRQGCPLERG